MDATMYSIIGPANTNAIPASATVINAVNEITADASSEAPSRSPFAMKPPNTGINAAPNAPDMTTKKSRSGTRKALTYASYSPDVPN
jgi:hypothetical protein